MHHLCAAPSEQYPYGSFNAEGLPVCSQHRLTACNHCRQFFPRAVTVQQIVAWSRSNRPIHGRLCGQCNKDYVAPKPSPEWLVALRYNWRTAAVFVAVAVVAGVLIGLSSQFFGGSDSKQAPPRTAGISAPQS